MKKNYLHVVLWLVLLTIIALLVINKLPQPEIGDIKLKEVDILSDLREKDDDKADLAIAESVDSKVDSILAEKGKKMPATAGKKVAAKATNAYVNEVDDEIEDTPVNSVEPGMADIEDFSLGEGHGMAPYYDAVAKMKSEGGVVRIAVLGDSYIEGDILTADLRSMLQQRHGGCGVGYVPITSEIYGFRRSVRHSFSGWNTHNVTDTAGFERSKEIISGSYFIPDSAATVELRGQKRYYSLLDSCEESSIYFRSLADCTVSAIVNGSERHKFDVAASDEMQKLTVSGRMGRVRWNVGNTGRQYTFYGVTMDCSHGIVLDNYSMRGTSGMHLGAISDENLMEYDRLRHYDLIVLMFGLNAVSPNMVDYTGYKQRMCKVIEKIKRTCPESGILVVSVGDREERRDGELRTMRGVLAMVKFQRLMAAESGVAFWNMFEGMGGEGSIVKMVEAKQANLDYTHINFAGGKKLAGYLFDALVRGEESYGIRQ
mgnify:CR=1 FL=1